MQLGCGSGQAISCVCQMLVLGGQGAVGSVLHCPLKSCMTHCLVSGHSRHSQLPVLGVGFSVWLLPTAGIKDASMCFLFSNHVGSGFVLHGVERCVIEACPQVGFALLHLELWHCRINKCRLRKCSCCVVLTKADMSEVLEQVCVCVCVCSRSSALLSHNGQVSIFASWYVDAVVIEFKPDTTCEAFCFQQVGT